ncbi:MAG: MFS transporter [Alphaproteobacteria bacterium]|nr:MAG: MFS transporter [Alphaproteobacteria bacterium]
MGMGSLLAEDQKSQKSAPNRNLVPYFSSHAGWYGALGLQMVLFPYLAAVYLHMPARYIGFAQLALMGPGLLFMLPGGTIADQIDERKHLIRMHLFASLPPFLMAGFLFADRLTYEVLLLYAFATGTCTAIATPARDALLNHIVAREQIPRAVAGATITQFASQMAGMALAGFAGQLGPGPFVTAHALSMLSGAFLISRISSTNSKPSRLGVRSAFTRQFRDISDALREIAASSVMWPVLLCNLAVGICFVGVFLVVVPVTVRDIYHGGSAQITALNVAFWLGASLSSIFIMRRGGVQRRGKVIMICLIVGTALLAAMAVHMPFIFLMTLMVFWGCGGGAVLTLGRTIIQEAAPASHRSRIMAAYQMGFMGGGPIGALIIGFLIDGYDAKIAVLFPAGAMSLFLLLIALASPLWRIEAQHCSTAT